MFKRGCDVNLQHANMAVGSGTWSDLGYALDRAAKMRLSRERESQPLVARE